MSKQAETEGGDYDLNARLIPPPMEEHTVSVQFRFIDEESPRIWTDDNDAQVNGG